MENEVSLESKQQEFSCDTCLYYCECCEFCSFFDDKILKEEHPNCKHHHNFKS